MAVFLCRSDRPRTVRRCLLRSRLIRYRRLTSPRVSPSLVTRLKSWKRTRFKNGSVRGLSYSYRLDPSIEKNRLITRVRRFVLPGKIYRHSNIYRPLKYRNGSTPRKPIVLVSTQASKALNQTASYLIIDKTQWIKYGFVPKENNSVEEIVAALILDWEANLKSNRIKVKKYRYLKLREGSQWYQVQSFLVNVIANSSAGKFPDPQSFLI